MTGFIQFRSVALIALAATALGACVQILDGDFVVVDNGSAGAGPGGAGGMGGMTSGGGMGGDGPAGSGGMGGMGGFSNPGCDPLDSDACPDGFKCGVVSLMTGDTDCVVAGPRPPFSPCDEDSQCGTRTFCSPLRKVCKPYCETDGDCQGLSTCVDAWVAQNMPVPGIRECIANCNPLQPQSQSLCVMGTTCSFNSIPSGGPAPVAFDCTRGGDEVFDGPCSGSSQTDFTRECSYGFDCFSVGGGGNSVCRPWCEPIGQQAGCPANSSCGDVGAASFGFTYGACL